MDIVRAKEVVRTLADGVDPRTGELFPPDCAYNSPEVIRSLFAVLEALERAEKKLVKNEKSAPSRSHSRSTPNAGKPWLEMEDDKLRDEFDAHMKLSEIAKEHGRSTWAIECRLDRLGLRRKRPWMFWRPKEQ
jgi:hypothetical protein